MEDAARSEAPPAPRSDGDELTQLRARVAELERERDQLVTAVDILQSIVGAEHFTEILHTVARKLGERFGLDRCSVFLAGAADIRLVASYEDPTIRNLVVDLDAYPELRQAFDSGETVFIADATSEPMLAAVRATLAGRRVRSIIVVPIRAQGTTIGAIFLRTEQGAAPFTPADITFCQVIAALTARALRAAHRLESLVRSTRELSQVAGRGERERVALLGLLRRLVTQFAQLEEQTWAESNLSTTAVDELDRLAGLALHVVEEQGAG